jgi:hypothetical protein
MSLKRSGVEPQSMDAAPRLNIVLFWNKPFAQVARVSGSARRRCDKKRAAEFAVVPQT